jgi:hypothetical protein
MRMTTARISEVLDLIDRTAQTEQNQSALFAVRAHYHDELQRRFEELCRISRPSDEELAWWQDAMRLSRDAINHLVNTCRPTAVWPPDRESR